MDMVEEQRQEYFWYQNIIKSEPMSTAEVSPKEKSGQVDAEDYLQDTDDSGLEWHQR